MRGRIGLCGLFLVVLLLAESCPIGTLGADRPLPAAAPESLNVSAEVLARIDEVMAQAIGKGDLPGAVVVVVHRGKVVFRRAYGNRSLEPGKTAMVPEVVFDLASLTKPLATAFSVLILVEQGKLRLTDLVKSHLPEAKFNGADITVEQLLLHTSGLVADNPLADFQEGRAKALQNIYRLHPATEPGAKFCYSDVGYIVLGELVEKIGKKPLDQFAYQHIYEPLGLRETGYKPQGKLKERAAPTERRAGRWLEGEVHDPRAFFMGGIAGHAGLFSTADEVAILAQMVLQDGEYGGRRVLAAATVQQMTRPRPVPGGTGNWIRAYGWDVDTKFSGNRGKRFPVGKSFGHTGFTGTSLWIDPSTQSAVIFLSNRVHPDGKGNVSRLRGQVATFAAEALPPYR